MNIEARIIQDKTHHVIMRIKTERCNNPWPTSFYIGGLSE